MITRAHVDITYSDNATFNDAFKFGKSTDVWTLAGVTLKMDIKDPATVEAQGDAAAALISLSSPTQIVVDDTTNRILHFNVAKAVMQAALSAGKGYLYDLVMIDGSGVRTVLMGGEFNIRQGITQS